MERVIITKSFMGIAHMQVCAANDASDEEILWACNHRNPSGTSNGWCEVIREDYASDFWPAEKMRPVVCADDPQRLHFMVGC